MTAKRCGWAPVEGLTRLEGFQEPWEKVHPPRLVLSCTASAPCIRKRQFDIQQQKCVDGSMSAV